MKQTLEISGRLASCNEYVDACRSHANAGGRMKRENQDIVAWCIKAQHLTPMHDKVNVHFKWVEPNMRRDKDNIRFAAKFILDALVESGVIKNDNWAHIGDMSDEFLVNAANPRIVVDLEEI